MARPSIYTEELAEALLQRLEDGESLASICRDQAMPSKRTVLTWAAEREDVKAQLDLARHAAAWEFDDEAKALLQVTTKEQAIVARFKFDVLRWRAAVHAPRVFGERVDVQVEGTVDLAAIISTRSARVIEARQALEPQPPALLAAPEDGHGD